MDFRIWHQASQEVMQYAKEKSQNYLYQKLTQAMKRPSVHGWTKGQYLQQPLSFSLPSHGLEQGATEAMGRPQTHTVQCVWIRPSSRSPV